MWIDGESYDVPHLSNLYVSASYLLNERKPMWPLYLKYVHQDLFSLMYVRYRYYQIMSTLLKLGLSGYDVNPRFCVFECDHFLQNPLLSLGQNFGGTRHLCKNEPTLDFFLGGGGMGAHGKVCSTLAHYP